MGQPETQPKRQGKNSNGIHVLKFSTVRSTLARILAKIELPQHCTATTLRMLHAQCTQDYFRILPCLAAGLSQQLAYGLISPIKTIVSQNHKPALLHHLSRLTKRTPTFQSFITMKQALLLFLGSMLFSSSQAQSLDCSFQNELDINNDGSLLLRRVINQADRTVSVELEYAGEGWLGFAFSESPLMVPNTAVIGLPDTSVVEKYDLITRSLAGVTSAADSSSLTQQTITQADGITILKFTKPIMEDGEVAVAAGDVRFNWAYGSSNTLGLHASRGSMVANFPECLEAGETAAPTAAPTPAVAAPTPGVVDLGDGRLQAILEQQGGAVQMVLTTDEPAGTITVEMTYAGEAWIAFGFSENELMPGSKAVIALPDSNTALQYDLNARSLNGVIPASTQTLLDSSMSQEDGVTTLTFTKLLEEPGELPISLTDDSIFLYAIGFDNTLAVHQIREAVTVSGNISNNKDLWKAHGICMALSWAILVPLAVGSSVIRDILPLPEGMWFKIHRALNATGILLTIVGFSIAVHLFNEEEKDHFSTNKHHKIGLSIFIFAVLQGLSGIFRPHAPHKPDPKEESDVEDGAEETTVEEAPVKKTKIRTIWEYQHRILGTVAMVLGWYNCDSGLELFQSRFGGKDLQGALWGVIAAIVVTTVLLSLYSRIKKRQ